LAKKKIPELKIEWVAGRGNLLYLSLVEFKRETYLCVIDNVGPSEVTAYVLDYAEQEGIDLPTFLSFVTRWFYERSDEVPLSVALARQGLTKQLSPIFRSFDASYVSRIIGHAFKYSSEKKVKVKRRRVIPIHEGIEVKLRRA
jgi:hypothetical protein